MDDVTRARETGNAFQALLAVLNGLDGGVALDAIVNVLAITILTQADDLKSAKRDAAALLDDVNRMMTENWAAVSANRIRMPDSLAGKLALLNPDYKPRDSEETSDGKETDEEGGREEGSEAGVPHGGRGDGLGRQDGSGHPGEEPTGR